MTHRELCTIGSQGHRHSDTNQSCWHVGEVFRNAQGAVQRTAFAGQLWPSQLLQGNLCCDSTIAFGCRNDLNPNMIRSRRTNYSRITFTMVLGQWLWTQLMRETCTQKNVTQTWGYLCQLTIPAMWAARVLNPHSTNLHLSPVGLAFKSLEPWGFNLGSQSPLSFIATAGCSYGVKSCQVIGLDT